MVSLSELNPKFCSFCELFFHDNISYQESITLVSISVINSDVLFVEILSLLEPERLSVTCCSCQVYSCNQTCYHSGKGVGGYYSGRGGGWELPFWFL